MTDKELTSEQILELATEALSDLKGDKISVLNVKQHTDMMEFMVVCTGTSKRHVHALGQNVITHLKNHGLQALGSEGKGSENDWVLVDLYDVVVHVMTDEARTFYDLEKLWDITSDNI
ncbi:ribosome silencing factor [Marinomonas agarivorans]|nr:ribosome silencing factor [Marinomonas agarivorans]